MTKAKAVKQKTKPKRKPPRPRGRATKLTPAVQKTIVKAIVDGNYFNVACALAGVDKNTAYELMARGEGRDPGRSLEPEFANFANAVREAEARAECKGVATLRRKGNPVEFLSRRFSERWSTRMKVETWESEIVTLLKAGKVSPDDVVAEFGEQGHRLVVAAGATACASSPAQSKNIEPGDSIIVDAASSADATAG